MINITIKRILATHHHRNGISGVPFDVVLFKDAGPDSSRKVAILFPEESYVAVLDVDKLFANDIAFGSNSWHGDRYETALRLAVRRLQNELAES